MDSTQLILESIDTTDHTMTRLVNLSENQDYCFTIAFAKQNPCLIQFTSTVIEAKSKVLKPHTHSNFQTLMVITILHFAIIKVQESILPVISYCLYSQVMRDIDSIKGFLDFALKASVKAMDSVIDIMLLNPAKHSRVESFFLSKNPLFRFCS